MMTPEQIAADRAVQNATTENWATGTRDDGSRWLSIGYPRIGPHYQGDICCSDADAVFLEQARTRWPAALDEVERLTAENAAMAEALAKAGHAEDCESEKRLVHVEPCPFWTKGYCLTEFCIHGSEMGDVCAECPGSVRLFGAERCHPFLCNCYLSTLSDAAARGKKLMEMERRDTPVVIHGVAGLGVCACGEDTSGPIFCGHCGSRLVWQ